LFVAPVTIPLRGNTTTRRDDDTTTPNIDGSHVSGAGRFAAGIRSEDPRFCHAIARPLTAESLIFRLVLTSRRRVVVLPRQRNRVSEWRRY